MLGLLLLPILANAADKPIDPFDYNFCGGERVYPVVGVHFSTACGPRNMMALGRRGKISWFFPDTHKTGKHIRKGTYHLTDDQLLRLSKLAEVVMIAEPARPKATTIQYRLGVDFSGRPFRRTHTGLTDKYLPSTELFNEILALVPDKPYLPGCSGSGEIFDPKKTIAERKKMRTATK